MESESQIMGRQPGRNHFFMSSDDITGASDGQPAAVLIIRTTSIGRSRHCPDEVTTEETIASSIYASGLVRVMNDGSDTIAKLLSIRRSFYGRLAPTCAERPGMSALPARCPVSAADAASRCPCSVTTASNGSIVGPLDTNSENRGLSSQQATPPFPSASGALGEHHIDHGLSADPYAQRRLLQ